MSDATIRAAIKARLDAHGAVIGRVHSYERWAAYPAKFLALFQDAATKKIFGWEIVRTQVRAERAAMNKFRMVHRYMVRGFYGQEDAAATELAVNALVDLLVVDFMRDPLPGAERESFPQAVIETRMFGPVLCHVAEITLPAVAEVIRPEAEEDEAELLRIGLSYYLQEPADDGVPDAQDLVELRLAELIAHDEGGGIVTDEDTAPIH